MSNYKTDDFDFELPDELIAQVPLKDRSSSKLMLLDHETNTIKDATFQLIDNIEECGIFNGICFMIQ